MFYIISEKHEEIKKFITLELKHDVTIFDIKGSYSMKNKKMLMVIIPTSEHFLLKENLKAIDAKCFAFVSDNYESKGQDISLKASF